MREISATLFKARCLRLLDEVAETGESLVITKRGRPVARVEPPERSKDLAGSVKLHLSDDELVRATMGPWDVERE
ncbi:MAG: type II toxin-antitoxin system Phd/YefM family antitoxin [Thermoleophilaceae bacterium]